MGGKYQQLEVWKKIIKPLLHWSFGIQGDIALPTGRAISLHIPKDQCNNVLIFQNGWNLVAMWVVHRFLAPALVKEVIFSEAAGCTT